MKKTTFLIITLFSISLISMHQLTNKVTPFATSIEQRFIQEYFAPLTKTAKSISISTRSLTHPYVVELLIQAKRYKQADIKILLGTTCRIPVEENQESIQIFKENNIAFQQLHLPNHALCLFDGDIQTAISLPDNLSMKGLLETEGIITSEQTLLDKFFHSFNEQWK